MKNYDLLKVVATKLNGLQYGMDFSKELIAYCKENGIVICSGQSDDLIELDGAIYDEYGCYDGGTICIDENGNKADANSYYPITAVWDKDDISWQYEFEPKHEVFTIYEDADIYCKGIVFFVDDLKRNKENECKLCSIEPKYTVDRYDEHASTVDLCGGEWLTLRGGKDENGQVVLVVIGDDKEYYYPKYCPECGRKLHD